jgi:hypothetical protein
MKVTAVAILEDGDTGRVEVTILDETGNQLTTQYRGTVNTHLSANTQGSLTVYVTVAARSELSLGNAASARFG